MLNKGGMNTQTTLGIPSTGRPTADHLIPAQTALAMPLIAQLAAAHMAVLENWKRKFALDLSWQRAVTAQR
jgi:hypothetical protein